MEEHVYRQLYELEDTHWWFRGRRAVIHALLGRTPLGAQPRILDAGCGTGRNIADYSRIGDTAGVDPSPDAVAFCHARGLGQVSQSGSQKKGDRTVHYYNLGKPYDVTFVSDKATKIEPSK